MKKEKFSQYTIDQLHAEWHKERQTIEAAQQRQVALCLEADQRGETFAPHGPMGAG